MYDLLNTRHSRSQKTCWMKFEDWFWYNNHHLFELQAGQYAKCFKGNHRLAIRTRFLILLILTYQVVVGLVNDGSVRNFLKDLEYFTQLSKYLSFLTLLVGVVKGNLTSEEMNELCCIRDREYHLRKYRPTRAWKWFTFLFQMVLVMELVVTIFYWTFLYDPDEYKGKMVSRLALGGDHTIPLACMLMEFALNSIPFCPRHLYPMLVVNALYLLINLAVTKIQGYPVYDVVDWKSVKGILLPLATLVIASIMFLFLTWVSKHKLKANGHSNFLQVFRGNIRDLTDPNMLALERDLHQVRIST